MKFCRARFVEVNVSRYSTFATVLKRSVRTAARRRLQHFTGKMALMLRGSMHEKHGTVAPPPPLLNGMRGRYQKVGSWFQSSQRKKWPTKPRALTTVSVGLMRSV